MSVPDIDIRNSPWYFPVHIHWYSRKFPPTRANVEACLYEASERLGGWDGWVRLVAGRPLPMRLGHMGHVFVGVDLSWHHPPVAGYAGGDLRYPSPDANWLRPAFVDDRAFVDPRKMGWTVAHEIDHLLCGASAGHDGNVVTIEQRAAGAKEAIRVSRGLNVPLPQRVSVSEPEVSPSLG